MKMGVCDEMKWLENNKLIYFPCVKSNDKMQDKKPCIAKWDKLKKPHPVQLGQRVGLPTGKTNNITLLDIDTGKRGMEIWNMLLKKYDINGEFDSCVQAETQHKGTHYYAEYDGWFKTKAGVIEILDKEQKKMVKVGIDTRNDGGYAICPSGDGEYKFKVEFDKTKLKPIPEWVKNVMINGVKIENGEAMELSECDRIMYLDVKYESDQPLVKTENYEFDVEMFQTVLRSLDDKRYDDYDDWVRMCFAVGGVAKTEKVDLLDILMDWSEQSDKHNPEMVEQMYRNANQKLGMGTIWWWLKQDNSDAYETLIKEHNESYGVKWYYDDYTKLIDEYKTNGVLSMSKVRQYIKDVYVKVGNQGNPAYYTVAQDKDGMIINTRLRLPPRVGSMGNDFRFVCSPNQKEIDVLHKVFGQMEMENDIPLYNSIDYIPYLIPPVNDFKVFNIFKPFPFQYQPEYDQSLYKDKVDVILNHIKYMCNDDNNI